MSVDSIIRNAMGAPRRVVVDAIPILEPRTGEICFIGDGPYIKPVKVIDGKLWGTHGFSNCWSWVDLTTGKEESGYGGFFTIKKVADYREEDN